MTEFETEEQVAHSNSSLLGGSAANSSVMETGDDSDYNRPVDYNMYKTFWDLQRVRIIFHNETEPML